MSVNAMPLIAGDRFTADGHALGQPIYAWKTVAESVTNSAVDQLDDELLLPIEPFSIYLVLTCLSVSGPTAAKLRFGYSVPTGVQGRRTNFGPSASVTATTGQFRVSMHAWPTAVSYGTVTGNAVSIIEEGVLYTEGTGGLLQANWAQNFVDASPVTIEARSFMMARQVIG